MRALEFIDKLRSEGRYFFAIHSAEKTLGLTKIATLNALHRLKLNKLIVSPARGFYLIVPPEYRAYGCLPADMFVPDLMKYFQQPYYVSFLSAAQFYGATHQKPQRFQVITTKNRPAIQRGRIYIEFIANKNAAVMPTKQFNTMAGVITVATPEVTAVDLVTAPHYGAGIHNVATVLMALAEKIEIRKLIELTSINPESFWIQRLGYLLEFLGFDQFSDELIKVLNKRKLNWVHLVSRASHKPLVRNKKWKVIVNTKVEPDE